MIRPSAVFLHEGSLDSAAVVNLIGQPSAFREYPYNVLLLYCRLFAYGIISCYSGADIMESLQPT